MTSRKKIHVLVKHLVEELSLVLCVFPFVRNYNKALGDLLFVQVPRSATLVEQVELCPNR